MSSVSSNTSGTGNPPGGNPPPKLGFAFNPQMSTSGSSLTQGSFGGTPSTPLQTGPSSSTAPKVNFGSSSGFGQPLKITAPTGGLGENKTESLSTSNSIASGKKAPSFGFNSTNTQNDSSSKATPSTPVTEPSKPLLPTSSPAPTFNFSTSSFGANGSATSSDSNTQGASKTQSNTLLDSSKGNPTSAPSSNASTATLKTNPLSSGSTINQTLPTLSKLPPSTQAIRNDLLSSLKNKSLESIINDWTNQIELDKDTFTKQALLVSNWDKKVNQNGEKILQLKQNVDKVYAAQRELDHNLELVLSQQNELNNLLSNLETQVEQWPLAQDLSPPDREREKGYKLAEDINVQLDQMSMKLKDLVNQLNSAQERDLDGENPISQIVQILNSHLSSLQWIDQTSSSLQSKLSQLNQA